MGGTTKLLKDRDAALIAIAKRQRACWTDPAKGLVTTKCGACKWIIKPTGEQLKLMDIGHNLPETVQLIAQGFTADELAEYASSK